MEKAWCCVKPLGEYDKVTYNGLRVENSTENRASMMRISGYPSLQRQQGAGEFSLSAILKKNQQSGQTKKSYKDTHMILVPENIPVRIITERDRSFMIYACKTAFRYRRFVVAVSIRVCQNFINQLIEVDESHISAR